MKALTFAPQLAEFHRDVLFGLRSPHKNLPCKWFYDERGSQLFDAICELPEYYPTRTEASIMRRNGAEMAARLGPGLTLIEYGAGSSLKTRILLRHLEKAAAYVPIDISREHLLRSAASLELEFPGLCVLPVAADYTKPFDLPIPKDAKGAVYYPGSTIGNFTPREAVAFLQRMREVAPTVLIGVDLWKSASILEPAYNDAEGVTAAFNLNLLRRINRELNGDFDLANWRHLAVWNREMSRIEMQLISCAPQDVCIAGQNFKFRRGEIITTEYSHKYSLPAFSHLAASAGFEIETVWLDENELFSVQLLRA